MSFGMLRRCSQCGTENRVPAKYLTRTGKCGACKSPLPPLSEPLDVDEETFNEIVKESAAPILVDFWAEWCGPCRMAAPEVKELAREMAGQAIVLKVNTEEHPRLAARFGVQSIPNFVVMRGGETLMQQPGFTGRTQMKRWLQNATAEAQQRS